MRDQRVLRRADQMHHIRPAAVRRDVVNHVQVDDVGLVARQEFGAVIAQSWLVPLVRLSAYTALVNLNLAVFNLIPLPPLDGYHVVNDLIFKGRYQLSQKAFRIGMLIVLVLSAQGILGRIISWVVYPAQGLLLAPTRAIWG